MTTLHNRFAPGTVLAMSNSDPVDPADANDLFERVNKGVVALRDRVTALEKRQDVVTRDEIDRISSDVSAAQAQLDAINAQMKLAPATGLPRSSTEHREMLRKVMSCAISIDSVKAAATTYIGPDGGFLVPNEIDLTVGRFLNTTSAMRRLSTVVAVGTNAYYKYEVVEGAAARWSAENGPGGETNTPKMVEIVIRTGKMEAEPVSTVELLQDSAVDIEAWLTSELGMAFAELEGDALVNGDGIEKPRGLMTYPTAANSSNPPWGTFGHINTGVSGAFPAAPASGDPLVDLFYALKEGYRANATWLANDATMAAIRKLKTTDGNFLWQPGLAPGEPPTILGRPTATDNFMPAIAANSLSIAFGDFARTYTVVDRLGIQILPNPYRRAGVVFMMAYRRVGGNVTKFESMKFLRFGS
jgi:HK97 family phage major capsid protein